MPRELMEPANDAEKLLLECAQKGEPAYVANFDDKTVRAEFLRDICVRAGDYELHEKGVQLLGADIDGALDFEAATLLRPLWLFECVLKAGLMLRDAETRSLGFPSCIIAGISGDRLRVKGTLSLSDAAVSGETRPLGADIEGDLVCSNAGFCNLDSEKAFSADGIRIGGSLFMRDTTAVGETRLLGADIGANVNCLDALLLNPEGDAFTADRIRVGGSVFLANVSAIGETWLVGACIEGNLDCAGATFDNPGGNAFCAQRLAVGGRFFLTAVKNFAGSLDLMHARVGDSTMMAVLGRSRVGFGSTALHTKTLCPIGIRP